MLILPDSDVSSGQDLLQACLSDPGLQQATQAFLSQTCTVIPASRRSLYVNQGEQATVAWSTQEELALGSQSATTCVILVARCPVTRLAYAVHHDTGSIKLPTSNLTAFLTGMQQPEVYLVGGFYEASGASHTTCCALLQALHQHTAHIHLKLACLYTSNVSTTTGAPLAHSLYVDCSSGLAYPGLLADRGPEMPRRFAAAACCAWNGIEYGLVTIAHPAHPGLMAVPALPVWMAAPYEAYLSRKLQLPDDRLLKASSTSPDHEPWYFVHDLRASYKWMLAQQATSQQRLPAVCYRWVGVSTGGAGDETDASTRECSADGRGVGAGAWTRACRAHASATSTRQQ